MNEESLWKILVFGLILCAVGMATTQLFSGLFFIVLTFSGFVVVLTTLLVMSYKNLIDREKHFEKVTELLIKKYG